ncbi:two-component sensor histidine kinase [Paenibacillus selenitireducens]|uniref:histidine kinase n=2 Tax=Paenibacillus selenitireducens TaxID=1324314 RepID=A0A1T2X6N3_9BACL|nr:two-component sensor histidine kinase [Paenibacillus selenitireducens]
MKNNRIGVKLGLIIMSVFLVVLLTLGFVMNQLFTNFYYKEMKADVEELTAHFAMMASTHDASTDEMINTFAEFSNVSIFLLNTNGELLAHSGHHEVTDRAFVHPEDFKKLSEGVLMNEEHRDPSGTRYFVSAREVLVDQESPNYMYVLASTEAMDKSIANVRYLLILSGVGAFLLAIGITWFIAQLLSRPLIEMQQATRKISQGKLDTRLEIHSKDEVGSLAATINDLARDLQHYRDSRQEFFANISHELRTPLTYLEGYTQVLKEHLYETDEERDMYLHIVHEEALRMRYLVNDLFELAKMEEGKLELDLKPVDMVDIIHRTIQKVQYQAGEKGLALTFDHESHRPYIMADPQRMEQILFNLLENALRYTEKGNVDVHLDIIKQEVVLTVTDTGVGIPEDELPYIFERFYRVEKSRSRQYGGTGLGLAIVKQWVEKQGGSIQVSSKTNEGTCFEIRFPTS